VTDTVLARVAGDNDGNLSASIRNEERVHDAQGNRSTVRDESDRILARLDEAFDFAHIEMVYDMKEPAVTVFFTGTFEDAPISQGVARLNRPNVDGRCLSGGWLLAARRAFRIRGGRRRMKVIARPAKAVCSDVDGWTNI
jgi:hypothetical protein